MSTKKTQLSFDMEYKELLKRKNLRMQEKDEIIIDIDDKTEHGYFCLVETCKKLIKVGYHIELWYARGMKNPHIHIKNIPSISDLSLEEGKNYRRLFYTKYIPKEFWRDKPLNEYQKEIPDWSIVNPYKDKYHPIAEENKPHYKHKNIKVLVSEFNKGMQNFCEPDLFESARERTKSKSLLKKDIDYTNTLSGRISSKISIIGLADQFGLTPLGKTLRVCPFHPDKSPSLSLNDKIGVFNCFGCHTSGNIIKFYAMLKKLNPKFKLEIKQK